jgi:hypothetical protein
MMFDFSRCKTMPWAHQMKELENHADDISRALWWQMRTGKSKVIIDNACHLYEAGKIDAVIVFAPNGINDNWILRQLPPHMWDSVPYMGLCWKASTAGDNAPRSAKLAWEAEFVASLKFQGLVFYTFNSESINRIDVKKLLAKIAKKRVFMSVWDESADFRRPGAKRTNAARHFSRYAAYRRILDGTPVHNSPLHAFAQMELLKKGCLGYTRFDDFKTHFADWEKAFKGRGLKVKNYKNLEELRSLLAPYSSVVMRADCEDLPDLIHRERIIPLTIEQKDILKALIAREKIQLEGKDLDISTQCSILAKMQQVCGGFIFNKWGVPLPMPGDNPRIEALIDEVSLAPGKVIVWAQYKPELKIIKAELLKAGFRSVQYHGDVSAEDRAKALDDFANKDALKVFIGQPQAGGRGLEILADTMIWYSHNFSGIVRAQACERATKMGHTNVEVVDFIAEQGPDRYIRDKVAAALTIADDLAGRGLKRVLEEIEG